MSKKVEAMTEEELREELKKIRDERSGVGRRRVKAAKSKRMYEVQTERRRKSEAQKEESAEWI